MQIEILTQRILAGEQISRPEALDLISLPLEQLQQSAQQITAQFSDNKVELCCISNGKCGLCSEDCKFCAQSSHYKTHITPSRLKDIDTFFEEAQSAQDKNIQRFSIVTAAAKLSKRELQTVCAVYKRISSELSIKCCGSLGLLNEEEFLLLKEHGLDRVHDNIETSRRFFPSICTTHSYDDKLNSLKAAKRAGLSLCSGCIIGMGETMEDRIDIALQLRELEVHSCPINILSPIVGTPLEHQPPLPFDEIKRTVGLFRHILPRTVLRLAGGREQIKDSYTQLYNFGINAQITGNMLTVAGQDTPEDVSEIIKSSRQISIIEP